MDVRDHVNNLQRNAREKSREDFLQIKIRMRLQEVNKKGDFDVKTFSVYKLHAVREREKDKIIFREKKGSYINV